MVETEELKGEFLPYICLFVPNHPTAYTMRFVKEEKLEAEAEVDGSSPDEICVLDVTTSVALIDAVLLKRPFIQIEGGPVEGKARFVVDGQTVAEETLSDFMRGVRLEDGLFSWCYLDRQFWAVKADGPESGEIWSFPRIGLMASDKTHIQVFLVDCKPPTKTKITVGLIGALYSTKK